MSFKPTMPTSCRIHQTRIYPWPGAAASRRASLSAAVALPVWMLSACSDIWNAGDLAVWVQDRAVEQGCQRETIALEEWYSETTEGNVWRGTCRDTQGHRKSFAINVDPVWTPSEPTN